MAEETSFADSKTSASDFYSYKNSEWCWVIDPLDGTNNFLNGLDYFAICIALTHYGEVLFGLVYRPTTGECYFAEKIRMFKKKFGSSILHFFFQFCEVKSYVWN